MAEETAKDFQVSQVAKRNIQTLVLVSTAMPYLYEADHADGVHAMKGLVSDILNEQEYRLWIEQRCSAAILT